MNLPFGLRRRREFPTGAGIQLATDISPDTGGCYAEYVGGRVYLMNSGCSDDGFQYFRD